MAERGVFLSDQKAHRPSYTLNEGDRASVRPKLKTYSNKQQINIHRPMTGANQGEDPGINGTDNEQRVVGTVNF